MKKRYYFLIFASFIFSFISLIASIRFEQYKPGMEEYLGIMVALIGICATFIVGWQIFSSMNVRDEIKKIHKLKKRLKKQEEENMKQINTERNERIRAEQNFLILYYKSLAIAYTEVHHYSSYYYFAKALRDSLDDPKVKDDDIEILIKSMRAMLYRIAMSIRQGEELKDKGKELDFYGKSKLKKLKENLLDKPGCPIKQIKNHKDYKGELKCAIEQMEERREWLKKRIKKLGIDIGSA